MDLVDRACRSRCDHGLVLDEVLRYDVTCRLIRHLNRTDLADAVLDADAGLALFGPVNWSRWPRYAPHYRGWLATPDALRRVYATSRVNLHEGTGIHFRQMDAMSTGGLLFFRETANDQVMQKVDADGNLLGFSVLRLSAVRQKPLEVSL